MSIFKINSGLSFDSNIYLITGKKNILVDTGTGISSNTIITKIEEYLGGSKLDIIILTHCHTDHVGGSHDIELKFKCRTMIGKYDASAVIRADSDMTLDKMFNIRLKPINPKILNDGDIVDTGSHILHVIWTPGHTIGSICLYDEITKSLFSGDTLFMGGIGRTDLMSGSRDMLRDSLENINSIDINGLYPGHGKTCENGGSYYVKEGLGLIKEHV